MFNLTKATAFALALIGTTVYGQTQPNSYTRALCVKAKDGRVAELAKYLHDVTAKTAKVRVDAGVYSSFIVAQSVVPAGRDAPCDFRLLYRSNGFPAEATGPEKLAEDMKKAGIAMTREQSVTQRDAISYLVSTDYWQNRVDVGGPAAKGSYVRVNYYRTKPGSTLANWVAMENGGWRGMAEVWAKESPGMGWGILTIALSAGTEVPYNGITYDLFPTWAALGRSGQNRATWNKVHPQRDLSDYMAQLANIAERRRTEVLKVIEAVGAPNR